MKIYGHLKNEFKNKVILITGGTGSIGLGIIKQLMNFQPKQIRIFSNDENSIVEVKETIGNNKIFVKSRKTFIAIEIVFGHHRQQKGRVRNLLLIIISIKIILIKRELFIQTEVTILLDQILHKNSQN